MSKLLAAVAVLAYLGGATAVAVETYRSLRDRAQGKVFSAVAAAVTFLLAPAIVGFWVVQGWCRR